MYTYAASPEVVLYTRCQGCFVRTKPTTNQSFLYLPSDQSQWTFLVLVVTGRPSVRRPSPAALSGPHLSERPPQWHPQSPAPHGPQPAPVTCSSSSMCTPGKLHSNLLLLTLSSKAAVELLVFLFDDAQGTDVDVITPSRYGLPPHINGKSEIFFLEQQQQQQQRI